MTVREFIKMHGLGNDFVVVDARARALGVDAAGVRRLADRHTGIGFDQMIVLEPAHGDGAAARMRIYNADGGEVDACGNATRCVVRLLDGAGEVMIETGAGLLAGRPAPAANATDATLYAVDMGVPRHRWDEIPLARDCDTDHLPLALGPVSDPVGVSMGNPHAVFFVDDLAAIPIAEIGPALERDPLFPERANIGFAQRLGPDGLRLRVWERGAGLTLACGTGACAAAVAAHRRGLTGRRVTLVLDGGELAVEWRAEDDHVIMTGPAEESFRGQVDEARFAGGAAG